LSRVSRGKQPPQQVPTTKVRETATSPAPLNLRRGRRPRLLCLGMRTKIAGLTDVGLLREHNEDSLLLLPDYRVVAVADGMGGHRSGDVASQLAVSTLSDFFSVTVGRDATWPFPADPSLSDEENYIVTGLRLANRRIFDRSLKTMADFGMGTTIVAAMFNADADKVTIGHVGDSRCYRVRGEEILQLTRDHSLVSDATHMAPWMTEEELRQIPSNVITRALGIREDVLVDLLTDESRAGDVYVLCSDGLSGLVSDDQIHEVVTTIPNLEEACTALIQRANFFGGTDNITVALARVEPGDDPPPKSKKSTADDTIDPSKATKPA
jgi:serine/threonine protein phosphatase PrpC